MTNLLHSLWQ